MFCFLLLNSFLVFKILVALFIILFSLQIFGLVLFEKQKKRFKQRINKALSFQLDVSKEKIKLYCKNISLDIVDENNSPFSFPNEENAEFIVQGLAPGSILPTKAIRVEIDFIKRDTSLDGPFEIHFAPSDSFTDTWVLKEITSENEGIFEHPIMGEITIKKIPHTLKVGDQAKIIQSSTICNNIYLIQYKIVD